MDVNGFPPGVRFLPTPNECIHYLTCKVTSNPLPDGLFSELDPYSPDELPRIFFSVYTSGELYSFTRLHRKGKYGNTNANRKVGRGTWHGEQTYDIKNDDGELIGMANKFIYRENGSQYDRLFRMTEYTLPKGTSLEYDPLNDYVLCHIVKNGRCHKGRKAKSTLNHQVAAVIEQPDPIATVAAENQVSYAVESYPSTSSCYTPQVETSTYVEPADTTDTPSSAPKDEDDNLTEMLLEFF